jgi:zinc protease
MIQFKEFILSNGLQVIHYYDAKSPLVSLNLLYNVGSRDENPDHTGLAHLFEHLMFSGSIHIPSYDVPLQKAGGTNNAFTNTDLTNYYLTIPYQNVETAFWLESDRMLSLSFEQNALDVQIGVVIEEFKQRYINQPYGDKYSLLRSLMYQNHPYAWPTIGKSIEHIEKTTLNDIKKFFKTFYNPSNAVLCIAGNIEFNKSVELCEKWFEPIPSGTKNENVYLKDPICNGPYKKIIKENVPQDLLLIAFKNVSRNHPLYYTSDLLSDILGRAESSILYNELVREKQVFTQLSAYVTGESEEGAFIIEGKLTANYSLEEAEILVTNLLNNIVKNRTISEEMLVKVKNKTTTAYYFALTRVSNIAMSLCMSKNLGDANLVNLEPSLIEAVSLTHVYDFMENYFIPSNRFTLFYTKND